MTGSGSLRSTSPTRTGEKSSRSPWAEVAASVAAAPACRTGSSERARGDRRGALLGPDCQPAMKPMTVTAKPRTIAADRVEQTAEHAGREHPAGVVPLGRGAFPRSVECGEHRLAVSFVEAPAGEVAEGRAGPRHPVPDVAGGLVEPDAAAFRGPQAQVGVLRAVPVADLAEVLAEPADRLERGAPDGHVV